MKTRILMTDKDDEKKEMEFEVKYMLSLTIKQRFSKMIQMSKLVRKMIGFNGTGRTINRITER